MKLTEHLNNGYFLAGVLAGLLILDYVRPYDNTDNEVEGERSGFTLYTDNLTGCQYLKAGWFTDTFPRLDGEGNHVGCK